MMQSIGILGGTFDPIHFGHLRMAQELAESLGLDEVRFIPAARPPHRAQPHGAAEARAEMVRLAISGNPRFVLDTREFERDGPSYMVDTLSCLRAEVGDDTPLCLLLGADAFLGLPTWHRWRELFQLAHVVVAHRPGVVLDTASPGMSPELRAEWQQRHVNQLPGMAIIPPDNETSHASPSLLALSRKRERGTQPRFASFTLTQTAAGCILSREITALDISASKIRSSIAQQRSARYLLPEAVHDYIHTHHLYQEEPHGT